MPSSRPGPTGTTPASTRFNDCVTSARAQPTPIGADSSGGHTPATGGAARRAGPFSPTGYLVSEKSSSQTLPVDVAMLTLNSALALVTGGVKVTLYVCQLVVMAKLTW